MGTTKKAIYKVHNGTDFDSIHFETEVAQIIDISSVQKTKPTLINNWINSDTNNYYGAEYWKDALGQVHVRGMISVSTGGTDQTIPFWLPAGYRPLKNYVFVIKTNSDTTNAYVTIRPDGGVIVNTPGFVATYINLGEIIFRAVD